MKRGLLYLAIGLSGFLLFAIALMPAVVVYDWLAPANISMQRIQGTIWNGRAASARIAFLPLGVTAWHARFGSILRGELGYFVETQLEDQPLQTKVSIGIDGTIHLRDSAGEIRWQGLSDPLRGVLSEIAPEAFFFDGSARLAARRIDLSNSWPGRIDGSIEIIDLVFLGINPALPLGSFQILFDDQRSDPLAGQLGDSAGPLELNGTLSITKDRCFELDASLRARPGSAPELQQGLAFIGAPDEEGWRHFTRSDCI